MKINIAIDGPSAAGKSTVAKALASKLGYTHLDTGAMYRAVAYQASKLSIATDDEDKIVSMINEMNLEMKPDGSVFLNGQDVSKLIRTNEMSMGASAVSKLKGCRKALVAMQQRICKQGGYILDGRDIGTVVLPDAPVKIYMIASAASRADRRVKQNNELGIEGQDYETILHEIEARDYQDMHREISPLRKADDAIEIDSSNLTLQESIDAVMAIVNKKLGE